MIPTIDELGPDEALFDDAAFQRMVDDGATVVAAARQTLNDGNAILKDRFFAHENIARIIRRHAWLSDRILERLWFDCGLKDNVEIALVAVGGYGRAELHPYSDIDLLILLADDQANAFQNEISQFITALWDLGMKVGHSVRSVAECVDQAETDITIATSLLEGRLLHGSQDLFQRLQSATDKDHLWQNDTFFQAKFKEQKQRHKKHNNTEYNLEPDVKNAPGGLRDIQVVGWVAKRHFAASRLSHLLEHRFLTNEEYDILSAGQMFLWEVRYALHVITDRGEDRLLFDYQRQVAALFGYEDSDANLAVEQFMKRYYRVALALSQLNEMLLQLFYEKIQKDTNADWQQVEAIDERFQKRADLVEARSNQVFTDDPSALLEIFVVCAQSDDIKGISGSTLRLIKDHRHLINETFRHHPRNIELFNELLRSPNRLFTQLRTMKRIGILGRFIPAFGRIIGQMQYDLFHIYTVDAHTLLVFKNMRQFRYESSRERFPIAYHIWHHLPKIELLYLAGLFHDIAKGRQGDHSTLGAVDARQFCLKQGHTAWDAELVAWLVQNHLLMSLTAQKKDVADPDVIHQFAKQVGDQVRLDYLYALTIADICATNPSLWNGWKDTLMRQLYTETRRALRRGLENPSNKSDWINESKSKALAILSSQDVDETAVQQVWDHFGEDYFLKESYADIAEHARAILEHDHSKPLVLVGSSRQRGIQGATPIFIYTPDQANLFAATVASLDQLGLTIEDARIITSNNQFSVDTYLVLEENGEAIDPNSSREQMIRTALEEALKNPDAFPDIVQRRMPRQLKHFPIKTEVHISNDLEKNYTVVEIMALDQPGLLAQIGRLFMEAGVLIHNARITTLGERAEDIFYITNRQYQVISDADFLDQLRQRLCEELDRSAS